MEMVSRLSVVLVTLKVTLSTVTWSLRPSGFF